MTATCRSHRASPLYTAVSADEIATAARNASRALRAPAPAAAPAHRFCMPTVAPVPHRAVAESRDW